jgi:hypothetical protein
MKEAPEGGSKLYRRKILQFQKALIHYKNYLSEAENKAHVYVYSDCAFIRSARIIPLIEYISSVRSMLLSDDEPLFFKGALIEGNLDEKLINGSQSSFPFYSSEVNDDIPIESVISGLSFSQDAVDAYIQHQYSKAIGIVVSKKLVDENKVPRDKLIRCIHFPELDGRPQIYWDIAFKKTDLLPDTLDKILFSMYISKVKSNKFERYYTSILCNWVQSIDISIDELTKANSGIERSDIFDMDTKDLKIPDSWYLFKVISEKRFEKRFPRSKTIVYLYFLFLSRLYDNYLVKTNIKTKENTLLESGKYLIYLAR